MMIRSGTIQLSNLPIRMSAAAAPALIFASKRRWASRLSTTRYAAHGQKFLVNAIVSDSDNVALEVTVNWPAGLKK